MTRIIGGVFGLEDVPLEPGQAPFLRPRQLLLANARSGLQILLKHLRPAQVWLPAFLCDSMIRPVIDHGAQLRYYPLDEKLGLSSMDWLEAVQPGDLVVLVDFFGFIFHGDAVRPIKAKGAFILEDASHALLTSAAGDLGDFVLYSPRKYAGMPDGGILEFKNSPLPKLNLQPPPSQWWTLAYAACLQRRDYDHRGGARDWLWLHQQAEKHHPTGAYSMSNLAVLITQGLNWSNVALKRIGNYKILAERLGELALFPQLTAGTVPYGFSIRVKNRDAVRAALFEQEIYPSLLWPVAGIIPDEFVASHRLSAKICRENHDVALRSMLQYDRHETDCGNYPEKSEVLMSEKFLKQQG
jgi:dTDP-4-amino-4,6-dideoxygalactose transaminase